nr:trypsin theta-like [Bactrocera oleae]
MAKLYISSFLLVIAACVCNINVFVAAETTIEEYPYIVSLQDIYGSLVCSGALIDSTTVVTAAQCLSFYNISFLSVGVGNFARFVPIAKTIIKSDFEVGTLENDVGLVKLAEEVSVGTIAPATKEPNIDVSSVVTFWDSDYKLVDTTVRRISPQECGTGYRYEEWEILPGMLCGFPKECGAETGSPLVSNNKLIGVVSWGSVCANKESPTVFTDIAYEASWITETARSL